MASLNSRLLDFCRHALAVGVFAALFHAVLFTLDDPGMVVDEPHFLALEDKQREWWEQLFHAPSPRQARSLFSNRTLRQYFDLVDDHDVEHGRSNLDHPLLGRHLANLSYVTLRPLINRLYAPWGIELDRWMAARLVSAVMYALLGFLLFEAVASRFGLWGGCCAVAGLCFMPRVFGDAHFDALNLQVAAWGFVSFSLFFRALKSRWAALAFGVSVGFGWATQFSGILVLVPLTVWALIFRQRRAVLPLALALVLAPATMIVVQPHWWHHPLVQLWDFLQKSTHRQEYMAHHAYYLGRRYFFSLPWHNSLIFSLATVPSGLMALGLTGLGGGMRNIGQGWRRGTSPGIRTAASRSKVLASPALQASSAAAPATRSEDLCPRDADSVAAAWSVGLLFWLTLRAMPSAPGHDGVRLFLPAFIFLAALIGVGAAQLQNFTSQMLARQASRAPGPRTLYRRSGALFQRSGGCLVAGIALLGAALELAWIHPHHLAYYNRLLGHPAGARTLGFESTYWGDAITPEVVAWINQLPDGTTIHAFGTPTLDALLTLGYLRPEIRLTSRYRRVPDYFLLFMRQSNLDPKQRNQLERRLLAGRQPLRVWSTRDGVPLVLIYPREGAPRPPAKPGNAVSSPDVRR